MSDKAAAAAPDKGKGSKSKLPMIIAAVVTLKLGVNAECRPLEEVAPPLSGG